MKDHAGELADVLDMVRDSFEGAQHTPSTETALRTLENKIMDRIAELLGVSEMKETDPKILKRLDSIEAMLKRILYNSSPASLAAEEKARLIAQSPKERPLLKKSCDN